MVRPSLYHLSVSEPLFPEQAIGGLRIHLSGNLRGLFCPENTISVWFVRLFGNLMGPCLPAQPFPPKIPSVFGSSDFLEI